MVGDRTLFLIHSAHRIRYTNNCTCFTAQLLCLIGEACGDSSDEICGAVINVRNRGDKISVWTRSANSDKGDDILTVGCVLISFSSIPYLPSVCSAFI